MMAAADPAVLSDRMRNYERSREDANQTNQVQPACAVRPDPELPEEDPTQFSSFPRTSHSQEISRTALVGVEREWPRRQ